MNVKRQLPLPDSARAPSSAVGDLVVRFYTTDDVSALIPLVDALTEAGRESDAEAVRHAIAKEAISCGYRRLYRNYPLPALTSADGDYLRNTVLGLLWHDVFDLAATLAYLEETDKLIADMQTTVLQVGPTASSWNYETWAQQGGEPAYGPASMAVAKEGPTEEQLDRLKKFIEERAK